MDFHFNGRVGNGAKLQLCRWLTLHQYGTDPFRTDNCWQIECWIKVFLTAQNPIKGVSLPPIRIHKSLWCLLESFYAHVSFSTIRSLLNSDCHRRQCSTRAHYELCDNSKAFVREQTCHFSTKCNFTSYCVHISSLPVSLPSRKENFVQQFPVQTCVSVPLISALKLNTLLLLFLCSVLVSSCMYIHAWAVTVCASVRASVRACVCARVRTDVRAHVRLWMLHCLRIWWLVPSRDGETWEAA